jgi:hypothetical protein
MATKKKDEEEVVQEHNGGRRTKAELEQENDELRARVQQLEQADQQRTMQDAYRGAQAQGNVRDVSSVAAGTVVTPDVAGYQHINQENTRAITHLRDQLTQLGVAVAQLPGPVARQLAARIPDTPEATGLVNYANELEAVALRSVDAGVPEGRPFHACVKCNRTDNTVMTQTGQWVCLDHLGDVNTQGAPLEWQH